MTVAILEVPFSNDVENEDNVNTDDVILINKAGTFGIVLNDNYVALLSRPFYGEGEKIKRGRTAGKELPANTFGAWRLNKAKYFPNLAQALTRASELMLLSGDVTGSVEANNLKEILSQHREFIYQAFSK